MCDICLILNSTISSTTTQNNGVFCLSEGVCVCVFFFQGAHLISDTYLSVQCCVMWICVDLSVIQRTMKSKAQLNSIGIDACWLTIEFPFDFCWVSGCT